MKYIITTLSTTLFLSLMIHLANYEDMYQTNKGNKISDQIIHQLSDRVMQLERQIVD